MENRNIIVCLECGVELKQITTNHLSKHGMSTNDYREKYGIHFLTAPGIRIKLKERYPGKRKKGVPRSEEDKQKMRKPKSEETKRRMRKPKSPEHRRKLADRNRERAGETVSQEIRNKISLSKLGKTYEEIYGPEMAKKMRRNRSETSVGRTKSKKTIEKQKNTWRKWWRGLSPEEQRERLMKSVFKANASPNTGESKLLEIIEPLGFTYNGKGPMVIGGKTPDFVNEELGVVVEYDGFLGHNSESPYIDLKQEEIDKRDMERNDIYRENGWKVVIIREDMDNDEIVGKIAEI